MSAADVAQTPESTKTPSLQLDAVTLETIRLKALRIAKRAGLPTSDVPDLEQDIALEVWQRLPRFNADRCDDQAAFVRMLVAHAVSTVLRGRVRQLRRAPVSLEAVLRHTDQRPGEPVDPKSSHAAADSALALDVEAILKTLPRKLRRVAEALKTRSVTAAARHLGLSRQAVYRRLEAIRKVFVGAGLGEDS
jgi:DNA-directed RNA polymerase specialized sigma24 family protein